MEYNSSALADLLLTLAATLREAADQATVAAQIAALAGADSGAPNGRALPLIDRDALTVAWNGRSCYLGYTTAFRLLERLVRRPNRYVSHAQLLDDVWGGYRSKSAIRSAVCDLRERLSAAGMHDLAGLIDGSNPGHYALMLF